MPFRPLLLLLLALALAAPVRAFGPAGHEIVADLAARHLDAETRAEVERLLGDRARHAMRDVAPWADELRSWPGFGGTAPLHYVNLPRGTCEYAPRRDCRGGRCIVGALARFVRELADARRSDAERADALRWVIHLVADLHQPLHVSYADDRGGNDVQLRFDGRGTNLHQLWDSGLLRRRGLRPVAFADALERRPRPAESLAWSREAPLTWLRESCAITATVVYPAPHGSVDDAYVERALPVLEARLYLAGLRLAALLDAVLGDGAR